MIVGGVVSSQKGVNLPGVPLHAPVPPKFDRRQEHPKSRTVRFALAALLLAGGSLAKALATAEQHIANGVTHFTVGSTGPDYDLTALRDFVAWRDKING